MKIRFFFIVLFEIAPWLSLRMAVNNLYCRRHNQPKINVYTHAKNARTKQIAKRKLHDRVGKQTQNNKSARGIESLTICTHCYRSHPCHIRLVSLLWSLVCSCLCLCVWPKCISTSRQTDWLVLYFTDWKVFVRKKTNRRHQFNIVWSQKKQ